MPNRIEKFIHEGPVNDFNWKWTWVLMVVALLILGISFWATKARAGNDDDEDRKVYICHCQGEGQEIKCMTKHLKVKAAKAHLKNHEADYRGRCEVPPTATPTPQIDECDGQCQPLVTPTPTEEPRQADPFSCEQDNSCKREATAPVCPDGAVLQLAANTHVVRNGSEATVKWFRTGGNQANSLYKENGQPGWTNALRDIQTQEYNEVVIRDLNPNLGYTFAVQQKNNCGGGETAAAIIVDPPANGKVFMYSYWSWL